MPRIIHVLTDSNIGGAGHHLLALLSDTVGFEVEVVLPQGALLTPSLEKIGIRCIELPYLAEKSFSIKAVKVLYNRMKIFKPDIVHTHAALSGRVAAKLYGCKIVHTRHSVFDVRPSRIFGLINNFLSHAMIAVSPAAKENLLTLGCDSKKIHVIYNGMPPAPQLDSTALRKKYNIPKNAFVIAQVARLTEVKGHNDVLTAAQLLPQDFIIIMAGDGDLRIYLESRIKNEDIKNVRLLGFVDEVEEIFSMMDIQISASFGTEATSLALIQGMSLGKPAVVTDYGGNPYVITDGVNGKVVPIKNPQKLAFAITELYNDCEKYRKNSKEIYLEKFTAEKMISETKKIYTNLGGTK